MSRLFFLLQKKLKEDVLKGYGSGGDDYVTKPFDTEILLAKIRAILSRRDFQTAQRYFWIGKFVFNAKLRTLSSGDDEKKLSPKEAQLLELLAVSPNELISREMALKKYGGGWLFYSQEYGCLHHQAAEFLSEDSRLNIKNIHGAGFQLIIREDLPWDYSG